MKLFLSLSVLLLSLSAFSDIVKPLPESDDLRKVAKAINTRLGDNNISSGGSNQIWAGKLKSTNSDLKALTLEGFRQAYKENQGEALPKVLVKVKVGQFKDGDGKTGIVAQMVNGLLESNDYDPDSQENHETQARYIWAVLRKLPVTAVTVVGEAQTTITDDEGTKSVVRYFLLIGDDQKVVQFLTIQGRM